MATLYPAAMRGYATTAQDPTVLLPTPGKVQPTAGHWRTSATAPVKPKPRTDPRPTSGRGIQVARQYDIKAPKRRTGKPSPSARALHSAWAKGKDII